MARRLTTWGTARYVPFVKPYVLYDWPDGTKNGRTPCSTCPTSNSNQSIKTPTIRNILKKLPFFFVPCQRYVCYRSETSTPLQLPLPDLSRTTPKILPGTEGSTPPSLSPPLPLASVLSHSAAAREGWMSLNPKPAHHLLFCALFPPVLHVGQQDANAVRRVVRNFLFFPSVADF